MAISNQIEIVLIYSLLLCQILKPVNISIPGACFIVALREEPEHYSGKTADGLCAEEAVFHLGQLDEVLSVRRCLQVVEVLVGGDAQVGAGAAQSELLFAVAGLS